MCTTNRWTLASFAVFASCAATDGAAVLAAASGDTGEANLTETECVEALGVPVGAFDFTDDIDPGAQIHWSYWNRLVDGEADGSRVAFAALDQSWVGGVEGLETEVWPGDDLDFGPAGGGLFHLATDAAYYREVSPGEWREYSDDISTGDPRVAVLPDGTSCYAGNYADDSDDTPFGVWCDEGGKFERVASFLIDEAEVRSYDLAADAEGRLHLVMAWWYAFEGIQYAVVDPQEGVVEEHEVVVYDGGTTGDYVAIAVSPEKVAILWNADYFDEDFHVDVRPVDGDWRRYNAPDGGAFFGAPDIALGPCGEVHLAGGDGSAVTHVRMLGGDRTSSTVARDSSTSGSPLGEFVAVAVTDDGRPWVGFTADATDSYEVIFHLVRAQ